MFTNLLHPSLNPTFSAAVFTPFPLFCLNMREGLSGVLTQMACIKYKSVPVSCNWPIKPDLRVPVTVLTETAFDANMKTK